MEWNGMIVLRLRTERNRTERNKNGMRTERSVEGPRPRTEQDGMEQERNENRTISGRSSS